MASPVPQKTLTKFANGLFQDSADPNSEFLAPVVGTGIVTFTVLDYAKRSGFQIPDGARAIGGDSKAVQSDGERVQISLKPNGLHDMIDQHELDQAGPDGISLLRQSRVQNIVSQASNSRFKNTIETINSVLNSPIAANWADANDPIKQIDTLIEEMSNETSKMPNRMLMSLTAWRIFRNNAKVIDRFPGMAQISVSKAQSEGFFINPDLKIMVCNTIFDSKIAAASSKGNAIAADAYLFYAQDGANVYDNSFAKTFRVTTAMSSNVRTSQKDYGEKLMVDWTEVVYVNNPAMGRRLAVTES